VLPDRAADGVSSLLVADVLVGAQSRHDAGPCGRARRPPGTGVRRRPGPFPSALALSPLAPGVSAVFDLQRAAGNGATASLLVPVQRQKKKAVGVAKYGSTKLTTRLQDMMQRGVLGVARDAGIATKARRRPGRSGSRPRQSGPRRRRCWPTARG
jgi:hypothetical protein